MKIVLYECSKNEKNYFRENMSGDELFFVDEPLSKDNLVPDTEILVVFIYSKVDKEALDLLPKLKLICTRSTGFDHIDYKHASTKNITVCTVPHYGTNTVAEHTFALILALSRKIITGATRVRAGEFQGADLQGFDLKEKTLGVIGTGNIGKHVIRIAQGFEMKIVAYDPFPEHFAEFNYTDLDDLLRQSDIITLHCPHNDSTHHLLNDEKFSLVKEGVIIINTARGGLIDSTALLRALESHKVAGAGLDVLEEENYIKEESQILSEKFQQTYDPRKILAEQALINSSNVIVTPHSAFNSVEAVWRINDTTRQNIEAFKKGEPINTVS